MSEPAFMQGVQWRPTDAESDGELPYATHVGELEVFGVKLRCYRISTGQAIIDADDMNALFGGMPGDDE